MTDADRPTHQQVEALRPTLLRIIRSVLRPDELDGWDVGWFSADAWARTMPSDQPRTEPASADDELYVVVHAQREVFTCALWLPDGWPWGGDLGNVVDGIEDFVSE